MQSAANEGSSPEPSRPGLFPDGGWGGQQSHMYEAPL